MTRPSARDEIRETALRTLPGMNYWSRDPVTRLDLRLGAYDDISSADVDGFRERLADALPGLVEHACSVGRRGGFLERLARGTFAAHIVEHVALELQMMLGDDVGYGRTRGGERRGDYVVAFSHDHAAVGHEAARRATAIVQRAFDDQDVDVETALAALRAARERPDDPPPTERVPCAVCAPDAWRDAVAGAFAGATIVSPAAIVERGLPYARSAVGVVLDEDEGAGIPAAFCDRDRREQLFSVMADGVPRGGVLVCPKTAGELREYAGERGRRVVTFDASGAADRAALLECAARAAGRAASAG